MPPELLESIAPLIAVFLLGSFTLGGMKIWFTARQTRRGELGRDEVDRLTQAVESLQDQVQLLREEQVEMHERIDFAERLLTKGQPPAEPPAH